MKAVKELLNEQMARHADFAYYIPLLEKAETNLLPHPDICIETTKSLLEGVSKTIIDRLDSGRTRQDLDSKDLSPLVKDATKLLQANDDQFEVDFTNRCVSLAYALGQLRNARGDISHGKAVPKQFCSGSDLARFVMHMTEGLLLYMLKSFYSIHPGAEPELAYEDNQDFNDYLDDEYPLEGKPFYSLAMFAQYREDYELQLGDYRDLMEKIAALDLDIDL